MSHDDEIRSAEEIIFGAPREKPVKKQSGAGRFTEGMLVIAVGVAASLVIIFVGAGIGVRLYGMISGLS